MNYTAKRNTIHPETPAPIIRFALIATRTRAHTYTHSQTAESHHNTLFFHSDRYSCFVLFFSLRQK